MAHTASAFEKAARYADLRDLSDGAVYRRVDQEQQHKKSFRQFLKCVRAARDPSLRAEVVHRADSAKRVLEKVFRSGWQTVEKAPLSETSGPRGGYTVPPALNTKLWTAVTEEAFVYPNADVTPMDERGLSLPKIDEETATTTAGIPSLLGGVSL